MKTKSLVSSVLGALALPLLFSAAHAGPLESEAAGWWIFEGNTSGQGARDMTAVPATAAKLEPVATPSYEKVSGLTAGNAGTQAIVLDGATVLKSPDRAFRIGGAQTLWLRVRFAEAPAGQTALMARSRPRTSLYGISLEMKDGALVGNVSSTGQQVDASVSGHPEPALKAGEWYDIALRFEPGARLQLDLYSPASGKKLGSWSVTDGVPAEIPATNVPGSGYLQIGAINNGSAGSMWAVPAGTAVDASGIWNRALADKEIEQLSQASK